MSTEKNTKDKVLLIMIAAVAVVTIFAGSSYLWKKYEFRRWVCNISQGKFCQFLGNIPEDLRIKEYGEWKKKNPGKM